jgi:hypothetical protein
MRRILAAIALTILSSMPAGAIYERGSRANAVIICSSEQAVLDIAHEDERAASEVNKKIGEYYDKGICGISPYGPRTVILKDLLHIYTDSNGIVSEVWEVETEVGKWFTIVVDPRSLKNKKKISI